MGWKFFTSTGAEKQTPTSVVNPTARVKQTAPQSISSNTWTQLTGLTTIDFDTDGLTGTANQITIQSAGRYLVNGSYSNGTTNQACGVRIKLNGTVVAAGYSSGMNPATVAGATVELNLAHGDVLTLEGIQGDTVAHNSDNTLTYLSVVKADGAIVSYVGVPGSLIGQELASLSLTANVTSSATTEAGATTIASLPSITVDGSTKIKIEAAWPHWNAPGVNQEIDLWDNGSELGRMLVIATTTATDGPLFLSTILTPTAGSHAYTLRHFTNTSTTTFYAGSGTGAGIYLPAYARITRIA